MKYFTKQWYESSQEELEFPYSLEYIIANQGDKNLEKELMAWEKESEEKSRTHYEKASKPYWEHYRRIEQYLPNNIKQIHSVNIGMSMHDCLLTTCGFVGKDFSMDVDSSGGFCDVKNLKFINAEILEIEIDFNNKNWWIYDEVYLYQDRKDRYEMHILFGVEDGTPNEGLAEMIIAFDDIIIDGNWVVEN